jgi:hypothetical protein
MREVQTRAVDGMDWEVVQDGHVVAKFNAQLRADLYARAESKQYPGNAYLIQHATNPEGEKAAIIMDGKTYVRQG